MWKGKYEADCVCLISQTNKPVNITNKNENLALVSSFADSKESVNFPQDKAKTRAKFLLIFLT